MKNAKPAILYVEDEPELRELICEILNLGDYLCHSAHDGKEAIKILENKEIDVMIVDFKMPEMRGDDLLFWCRKKNIHIPIIFFTGALDHTDDENRAMEDCCCSILYKPADFELLVKEIEKALKRHHHFQCHGDVGQPGEANHFIGQHYLRGR